MICQHIENLLGFACYPLNESGSIVMVDTPFTFADGDELPVFIERAGNNIRFFDDCEVVYHFLGRGLRGKKGGIDTQFITKAVQPYGLSLNQSEIEVWSTVENAKHAFANYISGLMSVVAWERNNEDIYPGIKNLVEEVSILIQAWRPFDPFSASPVYQGISKTEYKLDFKVGDEVVVVATPHPNSVGSALRKMVDIAGADHDIKFRVIIEDRYDKESAIKQSIILSTMATVMPFTGLEIAAGVAENATQH